MSLLASSVRAALVVCLVVVLGGCSDSNSGGATDLGRLDTNGGDVTGDTDVEPDAVADITPDADAAADADATPDADALA